MYGFTKKDCYVIIKKRGENMVAQKEELLRACSYFFEQIIPLFQTCEQIIEKEIRKVRLFRKTDYDEMILSLSKIYSLAEGASSEIKKIQIDKSEMTLFLFAGLVRYVYSLFLELLEAKIKYLNILKDKANKKNVSFSECQKASEEVNEKRNELHSEMKELSIHYGMMLMVL